MDAITDTCASCHDPNAPASAGVQFVPIDDADLVKFRELVEKVVAPLVEATKPENLARTLAPAIQAHVAEGTKSAVTGDALKAALDEFAGKLKPADTVKEEPKAGKGGDKGKAPEADPAIDALKAQIEALTKANAEAVAAAKAERESARSAKLYGSARDALVKHGAKPEAVDVAMSRLRELGVLTYDGDRPGWKGKNEVGLDAVLDLDAQAKAWLGTAEGKLFLPPVGASGTGEGRGSSGGASVGSGEVSLASLRAGATGTLARAMNA